MKTTPQPYSTKSPSTPLTPKSLGHSQGVPRKAQGKSSLGTAMEEKYKMSPLSSVDPLYVHRPPQPPWEKRKKQPPRWWLVAFVWALATSVSSLSATPARAQSGNGSLDQRRTRGSSAGSAASPSRLPPQLAWQEESGLGALWVRGEKGKVPLRMESLKVRTRITGPLASTQVTHVFRNHTSRVIEGTFRFRLPPQSVISRLAMDVHGEMMEGEIVEKKRARAIYEKIVNDMRDPALLEMKGGRLFQTRIYPIPAGGTKTVIIAYSHLLPRLNGRTRYRYRLPRVSNKTITTSNPYAHLARYSTKIDKLDLQIALRRTTGLQIHSPYNVQAQRIGSGMLLRLKEKPFRPRGDLRLVLPASSRSLQIWHQPREDKVGPFSAASFLVPFPSSSPKNSPAKAKAQSPHTEQSSPPPTSAQGASPKAADWIFVVDTSARMNRRDYNLGLQAVYTLLQQLQPQERFQILCGGLLARAFRPQPLPKSQRFAAMRFLANQRLQGGGNLQALLGAALQRVRARQTYIVYVGDGLPSQGLLVPEQLTQHLHRLAKKHPRLAFFGVAVGSAIGEDFFRLLSQHNGSYIRLFGPRAAHFQLQRLAQQMRGDLLTQIKVRPLQKKVTLYPKRFPNLARGDRLTFFANTLKPFTVEIKGKLHGVSRRWEVTIDPAQGSRSESLRYHYGFQKIEDLQQQKGKRKKIVALSQSYGVMSRYTSLLVLENEQAYKRHRIARRKKREQQRRQRRLALARETRFSDWLRRDRSPSSGGLSNTGSTSKIPQSYWSGGGGGGGGNGVGLYPHRVQPGDPVLHIKAPKEARLVYIILPHGAVKYARWYSPARTWVVRFLVPPDLADGVYHIQVMVIHRSGRVERRKAFYTVDTAAPRLQLSLHPARPRPGQRVRLVATQQMPRQEILNSLSARFYLKNKRLPAWGYDVQRVTALGPQGKMISLQRTGPNRWEASLVLSAGPTTLELSAADSAGNISVQRLTLSTR